MVTERLIFNIDSVDENTFYSNDDTCFSIDVIDEILEEDFDALLDEGSKILHSIEGTLLEEEIFAEFNEFIAMTTDENYDFESDTEDSPLEKITINTDYKIKTSLEELLTDLELKPLPNNLEYVFLKEPSFLPVIISSQLSKEKKNQLIFVLKKHKQAFAWKTTNIPEIKDRKGTENVAADHLSRIENDETSDDSEVDDNFPGETLMEININEPWFADFANYLVGGTLSLQIAVDYISKWAEAQALPTNDARVVVAFLKKLFFRFGMPKALISDRECPYHFEIKHRAMGNWEGIVPYIIAAGEKRMFQLHELDELRHQAYENSRLYKERTKVWHDRKLRMRKEFKQGNKVLLFHSKYKFKQPKLRSRWLGPYIVKHQYPSGYVELYGKDGKTFIVNGHRLKLYHEEDNDPREAVTPFFPN
ncbi:reverse transcriptase domain-containing protein [Tanacetum coccineum]|uniref:Reverse transcriptase domain-containing protein n=1 Tax=Tanacetum coccineum TaxID=301880 RepID=A0ABQ5H3G4_9ASTR